MPMLMSMPLLMPLLSDSSVSLSYAAESSLYHLPFRVGPPSKVQGRLNERANMTSKTSRSTGYNSPLLCLVSSNCDRLSSLLLLLSHLSFPPFCAGKREADVVTGGTALSTGHPLHPIHVVHASGRLEPAPLFFH
ncbi:hypothetical protein F5X97DRAFT_40324 [Nemania serpens]|nr:hypothetical protein F5X97DRAFT_40324 [Nemania serpens]